MSGSSWCSAGKRQEVCSKIGDKVVLDLHDSLQYSLQTVGIILPFINNFLLFILFFQFSNSQAKGGIVRVTVSSPGLGFDPSQLGIICDSLILTLPTQAIP